MAWESEPEQLMVKARERAISPGLPEHARLFGLVRAHMPGQAQFAGAH
jgi:hypothetical protein